LGEWFIKKMRHIGHIFIICAMGLLVGCSSNEKQSYFPPSSIPLNQSVAKATSKVAAVTPFVKPEGAVALKELSNALFDAQVEVGKYVGQVNEQSRELAKAQNDVVYWHQKQEKALRELWAWRLLALFSILSVVVYIGVKTAWRFVL
jgi:hypothetical protein